MADKNHPRAIKMLHHHGFLTRSDPTYVYGSSGGYIGSGRSDIIAVRSGRAVGIEVKRGNSSFQFESSDEKTGWRPNQRFWAHFSELEPFKMPYWIYLTVGKDHPHWNPEKYENKRSWLMPRQTMLDAIKQIEPYQKSIPYQHEKYVKSEIQENKLSCKHLFKDYELKWASANSLTKPAWMYYSEIDDEAIQAEGIEKVADLVKNKQETYGSFWIVPEEHPFYKQFIK